MHALSAISDVGAASVWPGTVPWPRVTGLGEGVAWPGTVPAARVSGIDLPAIEGRVDALETASQNPVRDVPVGSITAFGGASAPAGWLVCDGAAVSRSVYADLFAVVGTLHGAGDGASTFNLPDLRQRFVLGKADFGVGSAVGAKGGAIDHVHAGAGHTHTFSDSLECSTGAGGDHGHSYSTVVSHSHGMGHAHGIDPPNTATSNDGTHYHTNLNLNQRGLSYGPGSSLTAYDILLGDRNTTSNGAHSHTIDIAPFTSGGSSAADTGSAGVSAGTTTSAGSHSHALAACTAEGTTSGASAAATGGANPPYYALTYVIKF